MQKSPGLTKLTINTTAFQMSTRLIILLHKTSCCITQWKVLILSPWFHSFSVPATGGDPPVTMHTGFLSGCSYCCSNLSLTAKGFYSNSFMHTNSFQKFIIYNKIWLTTKNKYHQLYSSFNMCFHPLSLGRFEKFYFILIHSLNNFLSFICTSTVFLLMIIFFILAFSLNRWLKLFYWDFIKYIVILFKKT